MTWVVVIFGYATIRSLLSDGAISDVLQIPEESSGRDLTSSTFQLRKAHETEIFGETQLRLVEAFYFSHQLPKIPLRCGNDVSLCTQH